jgi:hypothetical protein
LWGSRAHPKAIERLGFGILFAFNASIKIFMFTSRARERAIRSKILLICHLLALLPSG